MAAARPPELARKVFRGRVAVEQGWLTRRQLESTAWRPLLRGVYADAWLPVDHSLFIAAARLVLPHAVVARRSAAWLYGAKSLVADGDPVEVLVEGQHRCGPIAGISTRVVRSIADADIDDRDGLRTTNPVRSAIDIARFAVDLAEAVVAVDVLLATGVLRPSWRDQAIGAVPTGRGSRQARRALQLADGRSESPQESRLRVGLVLAGLPPPTPQFEVRHQGRFVARVDLAYPEWRLAIEYDGAWHGAPGQLGQDRRRLNRLVAAGWRVIHVTGADLHDLSAVVTAIRGALGA